MAKVIDLSHSRTFVIIELVHFLHTYAAFV
jgi:hypothetical protein